MSNPVKAVLARRWFDKSNTYHSVRVVYADNTDVVEPFTYGYGDHYMYTAGKLIGMMHDPYSFTSSVDDHSAATM